jgi:outer membrane lipoprotein carrier protein
MRYLLLLLASLLFFSGLQAQKDPAAKSILDQIGAKVKEAKGILVSIQLISKNNKGKALGTKLINLKMKGDKYLLQQGAMEIVCDGANIYNFDGANSISKSSVAESDQTLSPQKLLSGNYDKDFNFKLLSQDGGKATIELSPIDKRKNFQKVTIVVDKAKSALSNATILDKSNNITDVKVVSINYTAPLADKLFLFNRAKYPKNVEIFD